MLRQSFAPAHHNHGKEGKQPHPCPASAREEEREVENSKALTPGEERGHSPEVGPPDLSERENQELPKMEIRNLPRNLDDTTLVSGGKGPTE